MFNENVFKHQNLSVGNEILTIQNKYYYIKLEKNCIRKLIINVFYQSHNFVTI